MNWVMFGSIVTAASTCATFIAALSGLKALNSWKIQEKTKALQNYKVSMETLRIVRPILQQSFSSLDGSCIRILDRDRPISVDYISRCAGAWASYSVYKPSSVEIDAWESFYEAANNYLYRGSDVDYLDAALDAVISIYS